MLHNGVACCFSLSVISLFFMSTLRPYSHQQIGHGFRETYDVYSAQQVLSATREARHDTPDIAPESLD